MLAVADYLGFAKVIHNSVFDCEELFCRSNVIGHQACTRQCCGHQPLNLTLYFMPGVNPVCLLMPIYLVHCRIHPQERTEDDGGCKFGTSREPLRGDGRDAKRDSDGGATWMADPKQGQQLGGGRGRILSSLSKPTPNTSLSEVRGELVYSR